MQIMAANRLKIVTLLLYLQPTNSVVRKQLTAHTLYNLYNWDIIMSPCIEGLFDRRTILFPTDENSDYDDISVSIVCHSWPLLYCLYSSNSNASVWINPITNSWTERWQLYRCCCITIINSLHTNFPRAIQLAKSPQVILELSPPTYWAVCFLLFGSWLQKMIEQNTARKHSLFCIRCK